jgi:histidinol-phosphate aminotransferase
MPSITHLIRPHIAGLEDYTPTASLQAFSDRLGIPVEQLIKLDANENPYGPSPKALAALAREAHYHIYPDPDQTQLRVALAAYTGQPASRILAGNGADEIIDLVLRVLLEPGDAVIDCPPTFGMYALDTGICAGRVVAVPRDAHFALDVEAIAAAAKRERAKVLFLASPNNPDGSLLPVATVEQLLALPLVVVLDEAYVEFSNTSMAHLVERHPNLVVLRTFSKWAGLAGLRIGYGVLHEELAGALWKIKQPYNINVAAETAALASLDDRDYLLGNVARIVAERARLVVALKQLDWLRPYPSAANFVLCRLVGRDAAQVRDNLARRGMLVRHYHKPALRDCIRISVGRPEQTDALIHALHDLD